MKDISIPRLEWILNYLLLYCLLADFLNFHQVLTELIIPRLDFSKSNRRHSIFFDYSSHPFANYTIWSYLTIVCIRYHRVISNIIQMTEESASDKKKFQVFFSLALSSMMKRHDKIFAVECTNTCSKRPLLCVSHLALKILKKSNNKTCWSLNDGWVVSRKRDERQLECAKNDQVRNVFCQFYDDDSIAFDDWKCRRRSIR